MAAQELFTTTLYDDANLKAYYRLEDVSDSKGGNTLTNNNSVAFAAGQFNNAADLGTPNTTKYLSAGNLSIAGNHDLSISLWLKLKAEIASGTWVLFTHRSTSGADRFFQVQYEFNGGTRRLVLSAANGNINYSVTLGTAAWYNILAVRDNGGGNAFLYVNGTSQGSVALGTGTAGQDLFYLGTDGTNYASVLLDDTAVFDRVVTSTEADKIANGGLGQRSLISSYSYFM